MAEQPAPRGHRRDDGDGAHAVRRALAARARAVDPGAAPRVQDLVAARPQRRWPAALAVAAGVAAMVVTSAVALRPVTPPEPVAAPSAGPATTAPSAPDAALTAPAPADDPAPRDTAGPPVEEPSGVVTGPGHEEPTATGPTASGGVASAVVWYVVEQASQGSVDLRLVPERVPLPPGRGSASSPPEVRVRAAVDQLLSSPPADPDHANPWWWDGQTAGEAALDVTVTGDGTVVDLPAEAFDGPVGTPYAGAGLGTVVRTVVSNGGTAPVTVLVDGEPDAEVWGAFVLDTPLEPESRSLAGGWVLDPWEGQRVPAGAVTVSGTGTASGDRLLWQVTDAAGSVVADGALPGGAPGAYESFSFTVDLAPGSYQVAVRDPGTDSPDEGPAPAWEATTTLQVVP